MKLIALLLSLCTIAGILYFIYAGIVLTVELVKTIGESQTGRTIVRISYISLSLVLLGIAMFHN